MTANEYFGRWRQIIDIPLLYQTINQVTGDICPVREDVFKAFKLCNLEECKAVFLGQDPYPQKGVATGILFGNKASTPEENLSPSLKVVKEAAIDFTKTHNYPIEFDNTLESWAKQGILMLNSALTVEANKIGSHTNLWRPFVSQFLKDLSTKRNGMVYVLFGNQAQTFKPYISKYNNHIIEENHPAYYARLNKRMPSTVFTEVNKYLKGMYNEEIVWYKEYSEGIF